MLNDKLCIKETPSSGKSEVAEGSTRTPGDSWRQRQSHSLLCQGLSLNADTELQQHTWNRNARFLYTLGKNKEHCGYKSPRLQTPWNMSQLISLSLCSLQSGKFHMSPERQGNQRKYHKMFEIINQQFSQKKLKKITRKVLTSSKLAINERATLHWYQVMG